MLFRMLLLRRRLRVEGVGILVVGWAMLTAGVYVLWYSCR